MTTRQVSDSRFLLPETSQKVLSFNGSTSYATLPITPSTDGFCIGFLLRIGGIRSTILSWTSAATTDGFKLEVNSTTRKLYFSLYNSTSATVNYTSGEGVLDDGKDYFLTVTFAPNNLKIYVNGSLLTTDTSCAMSVATGQSPTFMRRSYVSGAFSNGHISRVTFQNTTTPWTQNQIYDLYFKNKIPTGATQWSLNDVATDQNGENALTLTGTSYSTDVPEHMVSRTTVAEGERLQLFDMSDNSLYFNSAFSNSIITVGYNAAINVGTGDFSVIGWAYSEKPSSDNSVILYRYNTGTAQGFAILYNPTGKITFQFYNGGGSITTDDVYQGRWINFACIRKSGVPYIWINGVSVKTGTSAPGDMDGTQALYMGRDIGATKKLNGYLKDIHFYGRALTDLEIKQYFSGDEPATTNLIGHWKMNEGTGNVADSSGNSLTGTVNGAKWSNIIPVAPRSSV